MLSLMLRVLWLLVAMLTLIACVDDRDDGTAPTAEELPELQLTDETPELLLTWVDDKGGTETGVSISDVPEGSRDMVRVTTKDAGHGALFYVADLTRKRDDGS